MFFAACMLRILSRMLTTLNTDALSKLYFKSLHSSRPDLCISMLWGLLTSAVSGSIVVLVQVHVAICPDVFVPSLLVPGPGAVKVLNEFIDGSVVPEAVVFHVLAPRLGAARHLHVGVFLRRDLSHLAFHNGSDDSS